MKLRRALRYLCRTPHLASTLCRDVVIIAPLPCQRVTAALVLLRHFCASLRHRLPYVATSLLSLLLRHCCCQIVVLDIAIVVVVVVVI